jgi:putative ABC transport system permease protein
MWWTLQMAWRDTRGSRRRMLLYVSAMALGVAALVAVNGFGRALTAAVGEQSRTLLGADLTFEASSPFSGPMEAFIDSLGGRQARSLTFGSMVYAPSTELTRLGTVRALESGYPFYGEVRTQPSNASELIGQEGVALLDVNLALALEVVPGDSVLVGGASYKVAGIVDQMPGESGAGSLFSPRIYVGYASVDTTLLGQGAQIRHVVAFAFDDGRDPRSIVSDNGAFLRENQINATTPEGAAANWSEAIRAVYQFLGLTGFVALLLGSIGVAGAVNLLIRQRTPHIAVLRCLGLSGRRAAAIYLAQAMGLALVGVFLGVLVGLGLQAWLPSLFREMLPVDVPFSISYEAVLLGGLVGLGVTLLFALIPLAGITDISPLRTLRASVEDQKKPRLVTALLVLSVVAGVVGLAIFQAPTAILGIVYALAVAVVFGILWLVAYLLTRVVRSLSLPGLPYPLRQGIANLYRPRNQTVLLLLVLGLGTFLLVSLLLSERTLVHQIATIDIEDRPNLVFFDVQTDQVADIEEIVEQGGAPVVESVPIVTMRLSMVRGRSLEELRADTTVSLSWRYTREYRSTYRTYLTSSERVTAGTFIAEVPPGTDVVPISVEAEFARDLELAIGDTLVFDVQGVPVTTVIGSLREVDWRRVQTNFFVVFPGGILDDAPQTMVVLARTETQEESASIQAAVVRSHPNVSAIDIAVVMTVFDTVFGRIASVIRFMALFSVLAGALVLSAALVATREQRSRESVLLKTIGASRRQVVQIALVEYALLGVLAALTGVILAYLAGWLLSMYVFDMPFQGGLVTVLVSLVSVAIITVGLGVLGSKGVYDRPALAVLQSAE